MEATQKENQSLKSNLAEEQVVGRFWESPAGYFKSAVLIIQGGRIFKKEAFQLMPNNEAVKGVKARFLVITHLQAQASVEGQKELSSSNDSFELKVQG